MSKKSRKWPLLIYLDQKGWIDLAKIKYRDIKKEEEQKLLDKINRAVEEGRALFPLSIVHLDETNKISSKTKRQQLSALMVKLSKGYSISPYVDNHIAVEVDQTIAKKLGHPEIDIRQIFLKQGIHQLLGSKVKIVSRDGNDNKKPPKEIVEKMKDLLYDSRALEMAFTIVKPDHENTLREFQQDAAIKMDEIRKGLLNIKDKDLRRRVFLARNVSEIIMPHIFDILDDRGLPRDFFNMEELIREDMDKFLEQVPTGLTLITLMMYRDLQFQRPIHVNDIADVWGLALAIPYCDLVVTERMWAAIVKQAKLDEICDTIILSSIMDLLDYL